MTATRAWLALPALLLMAAIVLLLLGGSLSADLPP